MNSTRIECADEREAVIETRASRNESRGVRAAGLALFFSSETWSDYVVCFLPFLGTYLLLKAYSWSRHFVRSTLSCPAPSQPDARPIACAHDDPSPWRSNTPRESWVVLVLVERLPVNHQLQVLAPFSSHLVILIIARAVQCLRVNVRRRQDFVLIAVVHALTPLQQ